MSDPESTIQGEWWEPIATVPPPEHVRIMFAIPGASRKRREGEKRMKRIVRFGKVRFNPHDFIVRAPVVTTGICVDGKCSPGRNSKMEFAEEPTHWMHLPDLPDEYPAWNP